MKKTILKIEVKEDKNNIKELSIDVNDVVMSDLIVIKAKIDEALNDVLKEAAREEIEELEQALKAEREEIEKVLNLKGV